MVLLYIIIAIILFFVVLLFAVASKVIAHLDTAASNISITMLWLYPVLKSVVSKENGSFVLSIYLFNKRILRRDLIINRTNLQNRNVLTKLKLKDVHVNAQYGLKDPFSTGIAFGAINMLSQLIKPESMVLRPDFLATNDYLNVDATAKLNVGRSLLRMV